MDEIRDDGEGDVKEFDKAVAWDEGGLVRGVHKSKIHQTLTQTIRQRPVQMFDKSKTERWFYRYYGAYIVQATYILLN